MTAAALPQTSNKAGIILILPIIAATIILLAAVQNGTHSIEKHGADAVEIHAALDCGNGPVETWQSRSWRRKNQFFQVCQLEDGRWGLRLVERTLRGLKEKTSFVVKDGSRFALVEYLTARAVRIGE